MEPNPAASSTARTRAGSASENGPGSSGPGIGGSDPVTSTTAAPRDEHPFVRSSPRPVRSFPPGAGGRPAQVVKHEVELWHRLGGGDRGGQMVRQRHEVKAQVCRRQRVQAAEHHRLG